MITGDIVRLREEIATLRNAREHEIKSREKSVKHMLSNFDHARKRMAKQTKLARVSFVENLKHSVNELRKELADDFSGAHKAWIEQER